MTITTEREQIVARVADEMMAVLFDHRNREDQLSAARAAIAAVFDWLADPSQEAFEAGEYDDGDPHGEWFGGSRLEQSWDAMLLQLRKEALGDHLKESN